MPQFVRQIRVLYHFTERSNLASIRSSGGLYSWNSLVERGIHVPKPGGNDWSHEADERLGLADYVHLCFKDEHPMEYTAKKDGRLSDTIFLRINAQVLDLPGVLFTDDVSNKAGVATMSREQANSCFDFEVMSGWQDLSNQNIRDRYNQCKKYEALIPHHIPSNYILNLG